MTTLRIVVEVECDPQAYGPWDVAAAMFGDVEAVDFDPASSVELKEAEWLGPADQEEAVHG